MHKRQNDIVPLLLDLPLSFLTFDHREHLLKRLVDTFNVSSVKLILNDIETRGSRKTLRNIYGYSIEDKELDNPDSEVFRAVFEFNNRIKGFLPISPSIIKKAVEKNKPQALLDILNYNQGGSLINESFYSIIDLAARGIDDAGCVAYNPKDPYHLLIRPIFSRTGNEKTNCNEIMVGLCLRGRPIKKNAAMLAISLFPTDLQKDEVMIRRVRGVLGDCHERHALLAFLEKRLLESGLSEQRQTKDFAPKKRTI